MTRRCLSGLCLAILCAMGLPGPSSAEDGVDYAKHIKPVLHERCYACHGALKQEGGLRLDTAALAIQGGENGPAIAPGHAAASLLLERVTAPDPSERMPPEGEPLTAPQIEALRKWISENAPAPANERPERDPRDHWAFRAPVRPAVSMVQNADWSRNPIDAFLASEHERLDLVPQPAADRRLWLRRVSLDLVGLPPTHAEFEAFLTDDSPEAYDRIVSRLLDSPQHGERWGRHWMDVWRYSDWWGLGAEVRNSQKHIWHWRDWIVESLNADKGYDQMLREMLAADELYPDDLDRLRAGGFLARQYFKFNRTTWLDGVVEHTSKAMLGLTTNCAKCHDHKYDPLSQVDYYRFRAIFEPYQVRTEALPGQVNHEAGGIPRPFDCNLAEPTYLHVRGDDRNPDKTRVIEPGVPAFPPQETLQVESVVLTPTAAQPGLRPFAVAAHVQVAEQALAAARSAVTAAKKSLADAEQPAALAEPAEAGPPSESQTDQNSPPVEQARLGVWIAESAVATAALRLKSVLARAAADAARLAEPMSDDLIPKLQKASRSERLVAIARLNEDLLKAQLASLQAPPDKLADAKKTVAKARESLAAARRGLDIPSETYAPISGAYKTPESNVETEESRAKPFPPTSTGRRSALARWITEPRHPLTARVAVNHIWARHMGRPLVATVFDFGRKGAAPTHPELLDWLAVELVESGWSMKHLHRLIVTSQAYRLSSSSAHADPATHAADPENRLYWRANPVRMEAQVVRDSLLALAGELDLTRGGPSIPVKDEASRRRSLYFVHSNNEHEKFLSLFDDASVVNCYRRTESIVPQQALALENSDLALRMSEKIAARIAAERQHLDDADFVREAFLRVLCVEPNAEERNLVTEAFPVLTPAARTRLIHALLNHNDFVTVR